MALPPSRRSSRTIRRRFPSARPARRSQDRLLRGGLPASARHDSIPRSICSLVLHLIQLFVACGDVPSWCMQVACRFLEIWRNKNVCKCDRRAETCRLQASSRKIFCCACMDTPAKSTSGVLLRAEVALVFEPFRTHAALVVLAVRRRVGRDAVLPGGIVPGRIRACRRAAPARCRGANRASNGARSAAMPDVSCRCLLGKPAALWTAST